MLNVGNYHGCDHVPYVRKSVAKTAAESLRADGDSEGDENDEHGVFGGCGASLVPVEAVDQSVTIVLPGVGRGPIARVQSSTCPIGRQQASVPEI